MIDVTTAPDDPHGRIVELFAREVPEIASGVVVMRAWARAPGVRTKVAVDSRDPAVDPIAACVGPEQRRIRRIVDALGGERVDVLAWSPVPERMIRNALAPMNVISVTLDHSRRRAVVAVGVSPFPFIPRFGPEHRELASRLAGWDIAIVGDSNAP